jgi:uncharacterized protein (DUF1786 family)
LKGSVLLAKNFDFIQTFYLFLSGVRLGGGVPRAFLTVLVFGVQLATQRSRRTYADDLKTHNFVGTPIFYKPHYARLSA